MQPCTKLRTCARARASSRETAKSFPLVSSVASLRRVTSTDARRRINDTIIRDRVAHPPLQMTLGKCATATESSANEVFPFFLFFSNAVDCSRFLRAPRPPVQIRVHYRYVQRVFQLKLLGAKAAAKSTRIDRCGLTIHCEIAY